MTGPRTRPIVKLGRVLFVDYFYYDYNLFWFKAFGYGLRCDRDQPTFVRRMGAMFGHGYISIGRWDIEFLRPGRKKIDE